MRPATTTFVFVTRGTGLTSGVGCRKRADGVWASLVFDSTN